MAADTILTRGGTVPLSHVIIADEPDLTIRVIDYERKFTRWNEHDPYERKFMRWDEYDPSPTKATDLRVNKDVLMKSSPVFSAMLGSSWREANQEVVELYEDTLISTTAMRVWFQILHGKWNSTKDLEEVDYDDIWHICQAAEKYAMKLEMAKAWFSAWWDMNEPKMDVLMARALLYPCWAIGDLRAFACVTRFVVYEAKGKIDPYNSTPHTGLLLPGRVLQQLNNAKNDLKRTLHTELWKPVERILEEGRCFCKEQSLCQHEKSSRFKKVKEVWPLDQALRDNSIEDLLSHLDAPDVGSTTSMKEQLSQAEATSAEEDHKSSKSSTSDCTQGHRLDDSLKEAVRTIRGRFQGLCLVCMTMSNSENDTSDDLYFACGKNRQWDQYCSQKGLSHGEDTWHHSYSGGQPFYDRKEYWNKETVGVPWEVSRYMYHEPLTGPI